MKPSIIFVFLIFLIGCNSGNTLKIYPLSPFSDSLMFPSTANIPTYSPRKIRLKYLIVEGKIPDSKLLKKSIKFYVDSAFADEIWIKDQILTVNVYKTSFNFNKDYIASHDDPIENHIDEKIAELTWSKGLWRSYDIFEDSRFIGRLE